MVKAPVLIPASHPFLSALRSLHRTGQEASILQEKQGPLRGAQPPLFPHPVPQELNLSLWDPEKWLRKEEQVARDSGQRKLGGMCRPF